VLRGADSSCVWLEKATSADRVGCARSAATSFFLLSSSGSVAVRYGGHQQLLCSDVFGIRALYEPPPTALGAQELYPPLLESAATTVFKGKNTPPMLENA
jgi:hypothetical protein